MNKSTRSTAARCPDTNTISTDTGRNVLEDIYREVTELAGLMPPYTENATTDTSEERGFVNNSNPPITTSNSHNKKSYIVNFPPIKLLQQNPARPKVTLHALQEWEGYVVDIRNEEFVVRLIDLTAGRSYESEEAVVSLAEISENDASRMVIGSIFRWVIGYERSAEGKRKLVSNCLSKPSRND